MKGTYLSKSEALDKAVALSMKRGWKTTKARLLEILNAKREGEELERYGPGLRFFPCVETLAGGKEGWGIIYFGDDKQFGDAIEYGDSQLPQRNRAGYAGSVSEETMVLPAEGPFAEGSK